MEANTNSLTDLLGCFRSVPTFVTAHTLCASRDTRVSYGWCLLIQGYFFRRKQNFANALGTEKENWGDHAFLTDNLAAILKFLSGFH